MGTNGHDAVKASASHELRQLLLLGGLKVVDHEAAVLLLLRLRLFHIALAIHQMVAVALGAASMEALVCAFLGVVAQTAGTTALVELAHMVINVLLEAATRIEALVAIWTIKGAEALLSLAGETYKCSAKMNQYREQGKNDHVERQVIDGSGARGAKESKYVGKRDGAE